MSDFRQEIREVKINPFTLSFGGVHEEEFLDYYFIKYLRHMKLSMFLGIVVWGLFGIIDYWIAPREIIRTLSFIRYGMVWPIMVCCYLLSYAGNPRRFLGYSIAIGILASAFGVIAKMALTAVEMSSMWNASLIVVFVYGYVVMRARFVWASLTGSIILAAYLIVHI